MAADEQLAGLGTWDAPVKISPLADFGKMEVGVREGFVLSRIDGHCTVRTICLVSGIGESDTLDILRRLRKKALILVGSDRPRPIVSDDELAAAAEGDEKKPPKGLVTGDPFLAQVDVVLPDGEDVSLKDEERLNIRRFHHVAGDLDYFALLGIRPVDDVKEVRRAFFRRSKQFHPDRFFGAQLGPYQEMLQDLFKKVRAAYKHLENDAQRKRYLQRLEVSRGSNPVVWKVEPRPREAGRNTGSDKTTGRSPSSRKTRTASSATKASERWSAGPSSSTGASSTRTPSRPSVAVTGSAGKRGREETSSDRRRKGRRRAAEGSAGGSGRMQIVEKVRSTGSDERRDSGVMAAPDSDGEPRSRPRQRSDAGPDDDHRPRDRSDGARSTTGRGDRRTSGYSFRRKSNARPARRRPRAGLAANKHADSDPSLPRRNQPVSAPTPESERAFRAGRLEYDAGNYQAAASSFRTALSFDPSNAEYRRRYEQAAERSRATTATGFFQRAVVEEQAGRPDRAVALFEKAVGLDPSHDHLVSAARALVEQDSLMKAAEYARRAIEKRPDSAGPRVLLGDILERSGQRKKAIRELQTALLINPEHADARALLEKIT